MIKISVDEGYAFDFLSILHLKNELRNNLHEVISQCETVEKLNEIGKQIAAKKNSFKEAALSEIRSQFNGKYNELTKE